jgi:hypothetical protein
LRDNLKTIKKVMYGLMALTIAVDFLIPRHEPHFFGDKIPGFWSVFGFVGCILLIKFSKGMAHTILGKSEDYYG